MIETKRLLLREFMEVDYDDLYEGEHGEMMVDDACAKIALW